MCMMEGVDISIMKIVAQWVHNGNTLFDKGSILSIFYPCALLALHVVFQVSYLKV